MANLDHIKIFKQGVEAWNRWREEHPEIEPDLSGKILLKDECWPKDEKSVITPGRGIDFSYSNLSKTEFRGFYFARANFLHADLSGSKFSDVWLTESSFRNANLSNAEMVRCNLEYSDLRDADLTDSRLDGCIIFGIALWGLKGTPKHQSHLRITKSDQAGITVNNLEFAQFINLILNNDKIRDFIDTANLKLVLILGRFTDNRKKVLDAIRDELHNHNYLPVLFDFEKPHSQTTLETVLTLAGMAHFVIADITDAKSILQELQAIVPHRPRLPIQPIILSSQQEPGMFDFFNSFPWVLRSYAYESPSILIDSLQECVIKPAEIKRKELQTTYLTESKRATKNQRSLKGIWSNKSFEKIADLEGELKEARKQLSDAILTRRF